ncbi:MAG: hypothetical protein HN348_27385, partial [Proteobacteria bacterium]|nr:hypothetical protein [Pseudomonadota bacterium]
MLSLWLWLAFAFAAPDALGLGDGHDGALNVNGVDHTMSGYYSLSANASAGASSISVSSAGTLAAGDIVIVIEMTGATAILGNQSAVDLSAAGVGQYDVVELSSVAGTTLNLDSPLSGSYTSAGAQVVEVPQYTSVSVTDGNVYCQSWDGATGGVLAFLVTGHVYVAANGRIRCNARGYRGGPASQGDGSYDCGNLQGLTAAGGGGPKGEGVTGIYGAADASAGQGNYGNGAGGGNCHNSGGGGGGNGGPGGKGAKEYNGEDERGGYGGAKLTFTPDTHLAMGGGGGAGEINNNQTSQGGNGGGIVYLRTNTMTLDGYLMANGQAGGTVTNDGAGGAGAGGSIRVDVHGAISCSSSNTIRANGGGGGDASNSHGPGGGGGGGVIQLRRGSGTCPTLARNGICGTTPTTGTRGAMPTVSGDASYSGWIDDCVDSDSDSSCDGSDACTGADWSGNSDGDVNCDDTDICPGFDDSIDSDGDTIPDGCDNTSPVVTTNTGLLGNEGDLIVIDTEVLVTDAEEGPAELVFSVTSSPTRGYLTLDMSPLTGTFTQADITSGRLGYQHGGDEYFSDSVTFEVSDGDDGLLALTVSATLTPVSDDPVIQAFGGLTL